MLPNNRASFAISSLRGKQQQKACCWTIYQSSSSLQASAETKANCNQSKLNDQNQRKLVRSIVDLGRKGLTDEALSIYYDIPQPTVRIMNSAIDACAIARPTRLGEAFDILEFSQNSSGGVAIKPNVFTFGALMSACARARRGDRALTLLKSMQVRMIVKCASCLLIFYKRVLAATRLCVGSDYFNV